jgi:hypothetical protein
MYGFTTTANDLGTQQLGKPYCFFQFSIIIMSIVLVVARNLTHSPVFLSFD